MGNALFLLCVEKTLVSHLGSHTVGTFSFSTNASLRGWGAILDGHPAQGVWEGRHLLWHINCLEIKAVFLTLRYIVPGLRGYHVLVWTDNISVVSYKNYQDELCSRPCSGWCSRSCSRQTALSESTCESTFQGIQT